MGSCGILRKLLRMRSFGSMKSHAFRESYQNISFHAFETTVRQFISKPQEFCWSGAGASGTIFTHSS